MNTHSHKNSYEQQPPTTFAERIDTPIGRRLAAAGVLGATGLAGFGIIGGLGDYLNGSNFSTESTTYTVGEGEGLSHALYAIEDVNKVRIDEAADYVTNLPDNIVPLADGLQIGEQITIPVRVED